MEGEMGEELRGVEGGDSLSEYMWEKNPVLVKGNKDKKDNSVNDE